MNWDAFALGFWHPFGAYCGLTAAEILTWKGGEAKRNGWTLWSFVYTPFVEDWHALLKDHTEPVYVLCSDSPLAQDPKPSADQRRASHYRRVPDHDWQPMPDEAIMHVTNPFKRNGMAAAFVVRRVTPITPSVPPVSVSWYSRSEERWRDDALPTRGEFLIRRGGATRLRAVAAVLELELPYLAYLKHEPASANQPLQRTRGA
jgi:hypothetical protein